MNGVGGIGLIPIPEPDNEKFTDGYSANRCNSPEHNPPNYLSIPEGYMYRHVCPRCGAVQMIKNQGPTFRG